MPRLITEWSTDDPTIAGALTLINDEPDPLVRLELEAALHTWQAHHALRQAERIRAYRERYPRRRKAIQQ